MVEIPLIIDYIFYLFIAVAITSFTSRVLDPKYDSKVNQVSYFLVVLLLFTSFALLNYFEHTIGYIEIISFLVIMWTYSILFFENNYFLKISVPVFAYSLYTSVLVLYKMFAEFVLHVKWNYMINNNFLYSIVIRVIVGLTFAFFLYVVYKYCNYRIKLNNIFDYIFFVIFPVITTGTLFISFIVTTDLKTSDSAMVALGATSSAMVFVSVLVMSLMVRAARNNEIDMENLMMKREQELYREKIAEANKSIEEIAVIRHDMKNKILCIGELINSKNYGEAQEMCNSVQSEISKATVLFHTDNIYLNSILNISYKKAKENNIDIKIVANCSFEGIASSDLVSVIGNLCDNAVEYLTSINGERTINVKLSQKGRYYFISVKNNLDGSVLSENPALKTHKKEKVLHGHGIKIVKSIARKYKGSVDICEENNFFVANVMFEQPSVTK